jgi:hypothetical protein
LKIVDGSDKGIGTQAGDKDSQPRSAYELDRHLNMTSSTHIIKAKKEQCQNKCVQLFGISRDCQDKTVSDCAMGQKLEISIPIENNSRSSGGEDFLSSLCQEGRHTLIKQ